MTADWDESIGDPGAFIITNQPHSQFYLRPITLEDFPGWQSPFRLSCKTKWVYPAKRYKSKQVFFANKVPFQPHQNIIRITRRLESKFHHIWSRIRYYNFLALINRIFVLHIIITPSLPLISSQFLYDTYLKVHIKYSLLIYF